MGQKWWRSLLRSQKKMHPSWKKWEQGSQVTGSPATRAPKHMGQISSPSSSLPRGAVRRPAKEDGDGGEDSNGGAPRSEPLNLITGRSSCCGPSPSSHPSCSSGICEASPGMRISTRTSRLVVGGLSPPSSCKGITTDRRARRNAPPINEAILSDMLDILEESRDGILARAARVLPGTWGKLQITGGKGKGITAGGSPRKTTNLKHTATGNAVDVEVAVSRADALPSAKSSAVSIVSSWSPFLIQRARDEQPMPKRIKFRWSPQSTSRRTFINLDTLTFKFD